MAKIDEYLGKRKPADDLLLSVPTWVEVVAVPLAQGALLISDGQDKLFLSRADAEYLATFLSDLYLPVDGEEF